MAHLYASFHDAALAEKAAGALLDYGVRKEDLSIVANDAYGQTRNTQISDAVAERTQFSGDRLAQVGDRMAGAVSGAVGTTGAADIPSGMAHREGLVHSSDAYNTTTPYGSTVEAGTIGPRDEETETVGDYETAAKHGISTTTPEDAGQGAVKGAEIGLGVGILAALAALAVPGVGLVLGGGALASAIGGAALTAGAGAIAGGVTGYLKEQGVPGEAAQRYQGAVESGGAILNVTVPSGSVDQATVETVLGKYNAADVHSY